MGNKGRDERENNLERGEIFCERRITKMPKVHKHYCNDYHIYQRYSRALAFVVFVNLIVISG